MENENALLALRREIDEIDKELLALFLRRMEAAQKVAEYKKDEGLSIRQTAREEEVLRRAEAGVGADKRLAPYARRLFATLMTLSREFQQETLKDDID